MHRRQLLKSVTGIPLLPLSWLGLSAQPVATLNRSRRVRPSDPGWPKTMSWEKLKREVGGNLIQPQPLLAACESEPNGTACRDVINNLANPYYIGDQPAGTQASGWLDAWISVPSVYAVVARSTADVVAAVNFARVHNLRLVIKGGGTATRVPLTPRIRCWYGRAP